MRRDYDINVVQLNGPAEPDSWYWKLHFKGTRINGGIADTDEHAYQDACRYRNQDETRKWNKEHVWDVETGTWIPRSALNL